MHLLAMMKFRPKVLGVFDYILQRWIKSINHLKFFSNKLNRLFLLTPCKKKYSICRKLIQENNIGVRE